jgi:GxxExxY protein
MSAVHHLLHSDLTGQIIGAYFEVYNELGAGFESWSMKGHSPTSRRRWISRSTGNRRSLSDTASKRSESSAADLLVNKLVLLELKAVETLESSHETQLLNCLRATSVEVGLLLNFGPKPQFKRLIYTNDRKRPWISRKHTDQH